MDVLTDLLHRARASNALVRQLVARPPWAVTYVEAAPLTVVATLGGSAWVRLDGSSVRLADGDIALVGSTGPYTIADDPASPPQFVIRGEKKYSADGQEVAGPHHTLAPRTYGEGLPGSTVMLRGAYQLHGDVAARLLGLLPPLAVVPAGPRTQATLDLLAAEVARDEPGQDAVLARLLDLVLVLALRAWCARPDAELPAWYRALSDPVTGHALRLLHEDPARRWTVGSLAEEAGMSRAAFAARFRSLVGQPPLAYLTAWRMSLAADLLRDTEDTVAVVARKVGYTDPFAFSVAFKRANGESPSAWRQPSAQG
jgi:AraC-like DNA-binding protein